MKGRKTSPACLEWLMTKTFLSKGEFLAVPMMYKLERKREWALKTKEGQAVKIYREVFFFLVCSSF